MRQPPQRVLVTGGTGFVGRVVCHALRAEGHQVTVLSRDPASVGHPAVSWTDLPDLMGRLDAVVNLAGESIAGGRWTPARKTTIRESRVSTTRRLVEAMRASHARPKVFVSASAVGFYGPRDAEPIDETAAAGTDFLAEVCAAWEAEAIRAAELGARVVRLRLGVVLAGDGGALAAMVRPFRFFAGGPLGDGRQYLSWIHRDDVVGLVLAILDDPAYVGAVNATSKEPVTNEEFMRTLGAALGRPAWLRTPARVLRLALGEMADMLLTGQAVLPGVALRHGYRFRYPLLQPTVRSLARL